MARPPGDSPSSAALEARTLPSAAIRPAAAGMAASSSRSGWAFSMARSRSSRCSRSEASRSTPGARSARGPPASSPSRARMAAWTGSRKTDTGQAPSAGSSSR